MFAGTRSPPISSHSPHLNNNVMTSTRLITPETKRSTHEFSHSLISPFFMDSNAGSTYNNESQSSTTSAMDTDPAEPNKARNNSRELELPHSFHSGMLTHEPREEDMVAEWNLTDEYWTSSLTFENGDHYQGQLKKEVPHGFGIVEYLNGDSYKGEFNDGNREGVGLYLFSNGDSYQGQFNNRLHGFGEYKMRNVYSYIGQLKDGKFNGIGRLSFSDGDYYEGEFLDDQKHGWGKQYKVIKKDNLPSKKFQYRCYEGFHHKNVEQIVGYIKEGPIYSDIAEFNESPERERPPTFWSNTNYDPIIRLRLFYGGKKLYQQKIRRVQKEFEEYLKEARQKELLLGFSPSYSAPFFPTTELHENF